MAISSVLVQLILSCNLTVKANVQLEYSINCVYVLAGMSYYSKLASFSCYVCKNILYSVHLWIHDFVITYVYEYSVGVERSWSTTRSRYDS